MVTGSPPVNTPSTVTGILLDLIRQRKVASDRLLRENAYLRAEIARLTSENAALRTRIDQGSGDMGS